MKKFTEHVEDNFVNIGVCPLNSELIYITENNKQIGSLILCFSEGKASVFSVAILEKFRGKGYSKKISAKQKGCSILELNTEITNEVANNLYKSMGFELKGLSDEYNNYQLNIKE